MKEVKNYDYQNYKRLLRDIEMLENKEKELEFEIDMRNETLTFIKTKIKQKLGELT